MDASFGTSTTCRPGLTRKLTSFAHPELTRVVTAWPSLAPALKAAVLAITDSAKTNASPLPDFVHDVGNYEVIRSPITERSKIDFLKLNE